MSGIYFCTLCWVVCPSFHSSHHSSSMLLRGPWAPGWLSSRLTSCSCGWACSWSSGKPWFSQGTSSSIVLSPSVDATVHCWSLGVSCVSLPLPLSVLTSTSVVLQCSSGSTGAGLVCWLLGVSRAVLAWTVGTSVLLTSWFGEVCWLLAGLLSKAGAVGVLGFRLVVSKSNLTQLWLGLLLVFTGDVVIDGDLCVVDLHVSKRHLRQVTISG